MTDRQTDRQTDEDHVEITRKGLAHARPNYACRMQTNQVLVPTEVAET